MKNILILSPHTDDAEIGFGGSISKFIDAGKNILVVSLSCGTASKIEFIHSMNFFGINYKIYDFQTRRFNDFRQ